ncbi:MAG: 5'-deoxynucleotidase [Oscillospiraceae bacterium]|jgi:5'-deoxynucleotidase|nr:5'-deoxynucleotidase [Oscillospiraceae bacterium]
MYHFYALIARMKFISRWGLMRSTVPENVAEHSLMTAVLAHALAAIGRDILHKHIDPAACAERALFHDCAEIFTGDLPTPVKYWSEGLREAYREAEEHSASRLLELLPPQLRGTLSRAIDERDDECGRVVRAADKLAAHIKCLEEIRMGNSEFEQAARQTLEKLAAMKCEEADYFREHFLPSFSLTLDDLR